MVRRSECESDLIRLFLGERSRCAQSAHFSMFGNGQPIFNVEPTSCTSAADGGSGLSCAKVHGWGLSATYRFNINYYCGITTPGWCTPGLLRGAHRRVLEPTTSGLPPICTMDGGNDETNWECVDCCRLIDRNELWVCVGEGSGRRLERTESGFCDDICCRPDCARHGVRAHFIRVSADRLDDEAPLARRWFWYRGHGVSRPCRRDLDHRRRADLERRSPRSCWGD